jgi:hypothetical protein
VQWQCLSKGGVRWWRQGLTPCSSVVARSVEGSLEGGEEERACIWAFESHRGRGGGGALVKGPLTLEGVGVHVFEQQR